jgi:hypothetical protein
MRIVWWFFTQSLAYFGAALIAYSTISVLTQPWPPVEAVASYVSTFLTLFGVLVTAIAIYVPRETYYPPWTSSRWFAAPVAIVACLVAIVFFFKRGQLPAVLVNGFSLVGLSGGMQRILPTDPNIVAGTGNRPSSN